MIPSYPPTYPHRSGLGELAAPRALRRALLRRSRARRRAPGTGLAAMLVATLFVIGEARAQTPVVQPERLPALGRSTASADDTSALVLNPANLGFLPAAELRWQGTYLDEDFVQPWQGHAFALGVPLPFSLATGVRVDLVDPPAAAFGPGFAQNYQWLTWGLAYAPSSSVSFGLSLQRSYSDGPLAESLGSYSLGLSTRPIDYLGLSVVAHHVNGPLEGSDVNRLEALGVEDVTLGAAFDTALAVRPFGTRALEVGLEAKYLEEPDVWIPRGTLGIDVPYVGRLRGDFTMSLPVEAIDERAWQASAALSIYANTTRGSTELEGGALTGDALGEENSYSFFTGAAFRGWREPTGFELTRYAVRIRIEETPGVRKHVAFLRTLWLLAKEPKVGAVVFELRDSPAGSLGHVQELRDAIHLLRSNGKWTLCHLEDASGSSLYFCSATNRILINPAGGIRFAGLRTRHFYFKGLLDKIGVKADFVRTGSHKSAPERFTREGASDVARADKIDLLQQYERHFVAGVAAGRDIEVDQLRERFAKGPFIAREAKEAGLVDGYAFDDQLDRAVNQLAGEGLSIKDNGRAPVSPKRFAKQPSVALVYVEGDMVDGRSQTIPFIGMKLAGSYTLAETLKQVRESPLIRAVVLRVETPGGSSMAADVIWREVELTAKRKPVIVSMGSVAASGGYYISAPATRIYANPLSVTGSIGVFYGKADVSGLLRKIGVNVEVYKTAPRADAESIFRPFTPEERKELERKVEQFYDMFVSRVARGRGITKKQVDAVGRGRVWTGEQAKDRGLVDEVGGLRQALEEARRRAGLAEDAPIVELPRIERSLVSQLLGIEGLRSKAEPPLPAGLVDAVRAMAPFVVHPADKPLARMEVVEVELP